MQPLTAPAGQLAALADGRAAFDLSSFRKVRVTGGDARRWLNDLVATDVASLEPGMARRTLLLDATGHIRADLRVACDEQGFWLFQSPDQAGHVGSALTPYVLSADVHLADVSGGRRLLALPGGADEPGGAGFRPSFLGDGRDLLVDDEEDDDASISGRALVGPDAVEVWRIRAGIARMGMDFDATSIPAEAGLSSTIDTTKGCFLGQESVARVRNLGHPPRLLVHLESDARVDPGSRLRDRSGVGDMPEDVGVVTSAAERDGGGTVMLASVRWQFRDVALTSSDGAALSAVGSPD